MRLLDEGMFAQYQALQAEALEASSEVGYYALDEAIQGNSTILTVNDGKIQSDVQSARDLSMQNGIEHQVYIYVDVAASQITSTMGKPGTNGETIVESYPVKAGFSQIDGANGKRDANTILIAQAHGHPDTNDPGKQTQSAMSTKDQNTSKDLQVAIYGVDAMSGSGGKGAAANINRANPGGGTTNNVGNTSGAGKPGTFNIGRNAMEIWGRSGKPKM